MRKATAAAAAVGEEEETEWDKKNYYLHKYSVYG